MLIEYLFNGCISSDGWKQGIYWVETENFADYGGWLLDTQFAHKMGSGYLLAPGVGKPSAVASA